MLPSVLQSKYKAYKEDTNTIATWLATKAKKCGYSADLLDHVDSSSSSKTTKASTRLKGRARKEAREAAKAEAASSSKTVQRNASAPETPTYIIKVKDFVELASYIVGTSEPYIRVPASLVKVLDRAIELRKQHGSQVEASDAPDEPHAYFLGVLERIWEILKPRCPTETVDDRLTKPAHDSAETESSTVIDNMFSKLDVHEPSQEFIDAPDVEPAAQTAGKPQSQYEVETLQTLEEEYLASRCLLQDVRDIRRFLCGLWTAYQEGIDLAAVAITVNTAIDFVRTLEEDLTSRFPAKTDYQFIVKIFYLAQCLHRGHDLGHKQQPDDLFNLDAYELLEDIMMPTYSVLSSLQDVIRSGSVPQYKPGYCGFRDMRTHWTQKSPREKVQDDRLVMFEAFSDLVLLSMITSKYPLAEDELMRGIRKMAPGKDIPLWLVFAAQCFLDAQHELKGAVSQGHDQLRRNANNIRASIEANLEFHKTLRIANWPKSNDLQLTEMLRVMTEWVGQDVVADKRKKVRRQAEIPAGEPFQLLRQYPVICGLFMFALKMRFQEIGITFVNAWGSVMYAAQLYNAVLKEKLLSKSWTDMELVISLHGHENFFVGDAPRGLEEYLKRFLLSLGYSATFFASNRRPNANIASSKAPRSLKELCAVGKLFAGRFCNNEPAVSWTREQIERVIESKVDESDEEGDHETTLATKGNGAGQAKKTKTSSSGALFKRPERDNTSIKTTDFLLDLVNALHAETIEMSINYLRLHRFCWRLLRSVNDSCKPRLLKTYGPGYLEREDQLPFVVGYIFMAATAISRIAGVLLPRRSGVEVSSQLLMTAAEVVEVMIVTGAGAIETKMLEQHLGVQLDFGAAADS
ncbi:MAG: hypothetical protein Q9191_004901 [Dirinaria sp. TL-2023a]